MSLEHLIKCQNKERKEEGRKEKRKKGKKNVHNAKKGYWSQLKELPMAKDERV